MTMTDSTCKSHHPKGNQREPLTFSKNKSDIQRTQSSKSAARPICSPHIFHFQPPHVSFSDWWGLGPPPSSKSHYVFLRGLQIGNAAHLQLARFPNPTQLRWLVRGFPWGLQIIFLGAANRRRGPFGAP